MDVAIGIPGEELDIGFLRVVQVGEDASDGAVGTANAAEDANRGIGGVELLKGNFAGFLGFVVNAGGGKSEVAGVGGC